MNEAYIERLVGIYITTIRGVAQDAGWIGYKSIMAKWLEGEALPGGKGGKPPEVLLNAIKYLRKKHYLADKIALVIQALLKDRQRSHHILALLARLYYVGLKPGTDKPWKDVDRCPRIGQTPGQFKHNLKYAYRDFAKEWESARRYAG